MLPAEQRIRLALESLGPIFVKFGQILSTRQDMFPQRYIQELKKLQDAVAPFPSDIAINLFEKRFNTTIKKTFKHFSHKPLASASVAQVHSAILLNGDKVVVKILRPGIKKTITRDIALMKMVARILSIFISGCLLYTSPSPTRPY